MIRIAAAIPYALFALGLAYGVRAQERETCVNPKGFTLSADALGLAIEEHARWVMNSKSGQRALWCNLEITSIDLRGLDLRGVDLRMAKLPGADFAGARLDGALLKQADLRKSNFRGAILRKTDLSAASLIKANLTNANLQKAVLKNARFDDAKMAGADLGNAGFERTSFKGVDLRSTVGLTAAEHARLAPGSVKPPALTTPHASPTVQAGGGSANAPPRKAPRGKGGYKVQLGSFRNEKSAQATHQRMSSKYHDILGEVGVEVDRIDYSGRRGIWYRLRTGAVTTRSDAQALCSSLKQLIPPVGCLVVR